MNFVSLNKNRLWGFFSFFLIMLQGTLIYLRVLQQLWHAKYGSYPALGKINSQGGVTVTLMTSAGILHYASIRSWSAWLDIHSWLTHVILTQRSTTFIVSHEYSIAICNMGLGINIQ